MALLLKIRYSIGRAKRACKTGVRNGRAKWVSKQKLELGARIGRAKKGKRTPLNPDALSRISEVTTTAPETITSSTQRQTIRNQIGPAKRASE